MFLKEIVKNLLRAGTVFCLAFGAMGAHAAESASMPPAVMTAPAKPTVLPEFEFANLHGGTLKSSDMKGKVIVIRFWATW